MNKFVSGLCCLALAFVQIISSGCATILQPGPDKVMVSSEPSGARVYLDGQPWGTTPMMLAIPRDSEGVIKVEKAGYEPWMVDRDKVVAGWVFLDLFTYGIGFIVDFVTHNQGKYKEEPVHAVLTEAPKK